jgi:hypothetical protein
MRTIAAFVVGSALLGSASCLAQQTVGIVQPIATSEFLKLTPDAQVVYVAGIIEGMSFTAYGYNLSNYADWVRCVRSKTLGGTTDDVITFIKQTQDFKEGVGSALAQVLGKRCKR